MIGTETTTRIRPSRRRRVLRWCARAALALLLPAAGYFLAVWVLGAVAVNRGYEPAEAGTAIWVWNVGVHTDLVLPIESEAIDWRSFAPTEDARAAAGCRYVALGWGDRAFYLRTPRWKDLTIGTALGAVFWPTPTLMHVTYHWQAPPPGERCVQLTLADEEYRRLIEFVRASFRTGADGRPVILPGQRYWSTDAFYEAAGSFHLFNTCNGWANRALAHAGVRTAAWSPFAYAMFDHLEGR